MITPVLPGDPAVCTCDRPITPPELWLRCQPTSNNSTCVHIVCIRVWVKRHWMQHLCMRHNFPWGPVHNHMHSCQHMRILGYLQCSFPALVCSTRPLSFLSLCGLCPPFYKSIMHNLVPFPHGFRPDQYFRAMTCLPSMPFNPTNSSPTHGGKPVNLIAPSFGHHPALQQGFVSQPKQWLRFQMGKRKQN